MNIGTLCIKFLKNPLLDPKDDTPIQRDSYKFHKYLNLCENNGHITQNERKQLIEKLIKEEEEEMLQDLQKAMKEVPNVEPIRIPPKNPSKPHFPLENKPKWLLT